MAKGTRAHTDGTAAVSNPLRSRCSNAALRKATRSVGQLYDEILAPSGLRTTQHGLLVTIRALGAPTMGHLAEAMVMDLSGLGHTLKPLARDGFLRLVPDEADRRVRRVVLTDVGAAKLEQTIPLWQDAQDRFEAAFGLERTAALRDILAALATPGFRAAFSDGKARDDGKAPDDATRPGPTEPVEHQNSATRATPPIIRIPPTIRQSDAGCTVKPTQPK